jgi:hypothetical protein
MLPFCIGVFLMLAPVAPPLALTAAATQTKATPKTGKPSAAARKPAARKPSTTARKSPPRKPTTTTRKPATTARKATPSKAKAKRTLSRRAPVRRTTRRKPAVAAKPRVPIQPASERLVEIQAALAKAGYLQGEPTGKWDDGSIAAMKRFQQEHSIPSTGKINSLSLIALGLGPVRGPAPGAGSVLVPTDTETPAPTNPTADR